MERLSTALRAIAAIAADSERKPCEFARIALWFCGLEFTAIRSGGKIPGLRTATAGDLVGVGRVRVSVDISPMQ